MHLNTHLIFTLYTIYGILFKGEAEMSGARACVPMLASFVYVCVRVCVCACVRSRASRASRRGRVKWQRRAVTRGVLAE